MDTTPRFGGSDKPMKNNKLFVYGILKRGYDLDLANYGAKFLGEAHIEGATLYGIGPYWVGDGLINDAVQKYHGVGLRLEPNVVSMHGGEHYVGGFKIAHGELWEIPDSLWGWLDQIEQNEFCYTRKVVQVRVVHPYSEAPEYQATDAWVYEHTFPGFKYEHPVKGGRF